MRLRLLGAAALVGAAMAGPASAAVTQPSAPYDPSPLNGDTVYLVNQASGMQADGVVVKTHDFTALSQRWGMTKAPSGNWKISNVASNQCLDGVALAKCAVNAPSQEWQANYITNGYYTLQNASSHQILDVTDSHLSQSPATATPSQTQLWLLRPTFFRGNDSSLQEKAEYSRVFVNNSDRAPWWHDAYLPGQDLVQIFKNNGLNMIRVRPASINTTVVHDGVSFPITAAPYSNYTLAPPPATQIIPASANASAPGGVSSGNHAQTDWAAVDLAKRAKQLGMAVNVTLFYSGDSTAETPGNWAGKTVDEIAAIPDGLMYKYVKQEMELFRANGAWPDLVAIGNEVNTGMFNTTGANGILPAGTNCTPNSTGGGTGTQNCFARIQRAAMAAIADAASDTSNPALLGAPLPKPLTCIHVDGVPDLQTFFNGAVNTNGIPLDVACESYYPGWHGPLTKTQQDWHRCQAVTCTATQHIAEDDFASEANGLGLPIFTIEDGVSYTTQGSPQDQWYGVNPPGPSRNLSRQGMIDLYKVEQHVPHNLSMGMEWWAGESTAVTGAPANQGIWTTPGIGVFDASTTAGNVANNATLPVMAALGGRLDPTQPYKLVSAVNGGVLNGGSVLSTAPDTGLTDRRQTWKILAQGADPSQNAAVYPAPMDHRGDGFFQIANGNSTSVLDGTATTVTKSPASADPLAITGTNANQEWDVLTVGNCGDIPANCATPPTVGNGDGNYYVIVNKATGNLLTQAADGTIVQQAPRQGVQPATGSSPPARASCGGSSPPASSSTRPTPPAPSGAASRRRSR